LNFGFVSCFELSISDLGEIQRFLPKITATKPSGLLANQGSDCLYKLPERLVIHSEDCHSILYFCLSDFCRNDASKAYIPSGLSVKHWMRSPVRGFIMKCVFGGI